jgi:hypothetical protein
MQVSDEPASTRNTNAAAKLPVTFQVVGRTPFDVAAYQAKYGGPNGVPGGIDPTPFATGPMEPPAPDERGFKDTVKGKPGYFTTIRAKFALTRPVSRRRRPMCTTAISSNMRTTT